MMEKGIILFSGKETRREDLMNIIVREHHGGEQK